MRGLFKLNILLGLIWRSLLWKIDLKNSWRLKKYSDFYWVRAPWDHWMIWNFKSVASSLQKLSFLTVHVMLSYMILFKNWRLWDSFCEMMQRLLCRFLTKWEKLIITYHILFTVQVTITSVERSFSKLKLLKNYLRSTITQQSLNGLTTLCNEKKLLDDINIDHIRSDFASRNIRRNV